MSHFTRMLIAISAGRSWRISTRVSSSLSVLAVFCLRLMHARWSVQTAVLVLVNYRTSFGLCHLSWVQLSCSDRSDWNKFCEARSKLAFSLCSGGIQKLGLRDKRQFPPSTLLLWGNKERWLILFAPSDKFEVWVCLLNRLTVSSMHHPHLLGSLHLQKIEYENAIPSFLSILYLLLLQLSKVGRIPRIHI